MNRPWLALLLMWPLIAVIAACERPGLDAVDAAKATNHPVNHGGVIRYVDGETGCEYLLFGRDSYGKSIIPRLNRDGKQICGAVQQ